MQLIVLALVLIAMGKNANLKEIQPILESIGGEEMSGAIKQAEELGSVISAVQSLATLAKSPPVAESPKENFTATAPAEHAVRTDFGDGAFAPLAPIAKIADENITRCLSEFIALGE